jgi:hypothetical protein
MLNTSITTTKALVYSISIIEEKDMKKDNLWAIKASH